MSPFNPSPLHFGSDSATLAVFLVAILGLGTLSAGCGGGGGGYRTSANAMLAVLSTSDGALSPAFDASTLAYTVGPADLLSVGSVTVTPTAASAYATITVDGTAVASGLRRRRSRSRSASRPC